MEMIYIKNPRYIQKDVFIELYVDEVNKKYNLRVNNSSLLSGKYESRRETDQRFYFDDIIIAKRYMGKEIEVIKDNPNFIRDW
jgi:hypothetical protein